MKRVIKNGDEYDAYTAWRKLLHYTQRPGVTKRIKKRTHRRERRDAQRWIDEQLEDLPTSRPHKLENSDVVLSNTHDPSRCAGSFCTIHNMSDHHMRSFPQSWRSDRGFMERTCPHGWGHPDPDEVFQYREQGENTVHGCDGCCISDRSADAK